MLENIVSLMKYGFHIGVLYPFIIAFVVMLLFSILKIARNLRWVGAGLGIVFAIFYLLKLNSSPHGGVFSIYISRHDKMIYLLYFACIMGLVLGLLHLFIKGIGKLKLIAFLMVIACVCVNVYWYNILKIQSANFNHMSLIIQAIAGFILLGLLINGGFYKDVSSAIGLSACLIVYGVLFNRYHVVDIAHILFALSGVSVAYVLINYFKLSFRFSLPLSIILGGSLMAILNNEIPFKTSVYHSSISFPLCLLLIAPLCRFIVYGIVKRISRFGSTTSKRSKGALSARVHTGYQYLSPILCLVLSVILAILIII